jgi:hypothetical protein
MIEKYYTCETSLCSIGRTEIGLNLPVNKMVGRNYIKDKVNGRCMVLHRGMSDDRTDHLSAEEKSDLPRYLTIYSGFMSPLLRMTL